MNELQHQLFLTSFLLFGLCYDGSFYYFFFLQILNFPIYHARNQLIAISTCLSFLSFAFCYYHSFYYLFFLQTYIHKETGFRCRSLKEIKNYEKYGSPPRRHKVKTQAKEESNDKTKNETEVTIFILKNK